MTISWLDSRNRPLSGTVLEDTGKYYRVIVTSYAHKNQKKEMGKQWMVKKEHAQVMK